MRFAFQVPWADLRYLFGEIMYGGHIVNDFDRWGGDGGGGERYSQLDYQQTKGGRSLGDRRDDITFVQTSGVSKPLAVAGSTKRHHR